MRVAPAIPDCRTALTARIRLGHPWIASGAPTAALQRRAAERSSRKRETIAGAVGAVNRRADMYRLILPGEKDNATDQNHLPAFDPENIRLLPIGNTRLDFHFAVIDGDAFSIAQVIDDRGCLDVLLGQVGAALDADIAVVDCNQRVFLETQPAHV